MMTTSVKLPKKLLVGLLFLFISGTGCLKTKNVMFMKKERVDNFLKANPIQVLKKETKKEEKKDAKKDEKKDGKKEVKDEKKEAPAAEEKPNAAAAYSAEDRVNMMNMPNGKNILGGYCNRPEIGAFIAKFEALETTCRTRLKKYTKSANLNGGLYWGFMLGSIATSAGMIAGGLLPEDKGTAAGVAVGFGIGTFVLATVGLAGGFDGRQELNKEKAIYLDNFMWTLRHRFRDRICNAPNKEEAKVRAENLLKKFTTLCIDPKDKDGFYRP